MSNDHGTPRARLQRIARRAMVERGLEPDFPKAALDELAGISEPAAGGDGVLDLRALPWCSIDNDDSRDLDQLSVAEEMRGGHTRIRVAIADVDALVVVGSAIDHHARANTTSVYTPAQIFSMLPEKLSTGLTSLNPDQDRTAVVMEFTVAGEGEVAEGKVYRALVHNHAKLAYNSLAAWFEGKGPMPPAIATVRGLEANLRIQDRAAQELKKSRHQQGALDLETIEVRAVFDGEAVRDLAAELKNRAKELIEDFMIAANGVTARFLTERRLPSLRRVVRSPERWQRIVELAGRFNETLPEEADAGALERFLVSRRRADPLRFPDLSLSVVKLMGRGEYVVEHPGGEPIGHFGLAVRDYTHSTAPNRRFPDLIAQRLVKAALAGSSSPYGGNELDQLARHCTEKEDDASKVERLVRKAAAAALLEKRIGETFDGIVTGASAKGTWVRVFKPPVEGKVEQGSEGLDVGDEVRVKLLHTDVERGYIDFARA